MTLEKSEMDYAVDLLLERQASVIDELKRRFKKTKPFRQEPVSNEESLYYYSQMTPEKEAEYRQLFGSETIDDYKNKMNKLLARRR